MKLDLTITGGELKGMHFYSPQTDITHPMSTKIKQSIFNMIGDTPKFSVLDVFAGSGSLGFESISRGASSVTFVDNDFKACDSIKSSITKLAVSEKCKVLKLNHNSFLGINQKQFDIIFIDPPYKKIPEDLSRFSALLVKNGLLVVSIPLSFEDKINKMFLNLNKLKRKSFGGSLIIIYKK